MEHDRLGSLTTHPHPTPSSSSCNSGVTADVLTITNSYLTSPVPWRIITSVTGVFNGVDVNTRVVRTDVLVTRTVSLSGFLVYLQRTIGHSSTTLCYVMAYIASMLPAHHKNRYSSHTTLIADFAINFYPPPPPPPLLPPPHTI